MGSFGISQNLAIFGIRNMKYKFLVCHVILVSYSVLLGFFHILVKVLRKLLTVACRKDEYIEKKIARFEVSNSQGTQNRETATENCST